MRKLIYATATTLALALSGALAPANAMPINPTINSESAVLPAQFIFGGRNYCFYDNGWNGPGFYWCGYAFRRGYGWGGGRGWHGWHHGGGRPGMRPGRPHGGPGFGMHPGGRPHMGGGGRPGGGRPGGGGGRPGGGGHGGGGHGGGGHHR